jgi:hypothetical protein
MGAQDYERSPVAFFSARASSTLKVDESEMSVHRVLFLKPKKGNSGGVESSV